MFKIKIQGHLTSSILVPIDSACIYHFLLFIYSNWRYLLPFSRYWRILLEDSFFPHFTRCLTPLSGEMPCNINATYTPLKVHLVGYNSVADFIRVYLHSFSYCCLRNLWNFEKIRTYSSLSRDLRIFFFRSNRIWNRIGRPIRFRIESSNRIGRIPRKP